MKITRSTTFILGGMFLSVAVFAQEVMTPDRPTYDRVDKSEATEMPSSFPQAAKSVLPADITPGMVRRGQQIFTEVCFRCHTEDATGSKLAPNLTDDEWIHLTGRNYGEIVYLINHGVPNPKSHPKPMPPKGGADLSEEEVNEVAAFVFAINKATADD